MNSNINSSNSNNNENESTLTTTTPSIPSIRNVSWSPSNPNVLTTNYINGSSKEVKVTKRAAELDVTNGIISSSEYRRVTTVSGSSGGGMGIPSISASRVLSKWKFSNSDGGGVGMGDGIVIEGIEIVYSDGVLGDPMAAAVGGKGQQQQQQLSSKCRLRLQRPLGENK
jgi:hypothetical protein